MKFSQLTKPELEKILKMPILPRKKREYSNFFLGILHKRDSCAIMRIAKNS